MQRASYCNMYMNQQDAQILVISLYFYFSLDALHVSDSLVHHQERHFLYISCISQLACAGTSGCSQKYRHMQTAIYNLYIKIVAPDDGLKSPKHVEHLMIN